MNRKAHNSELRSDESYWYLREVQDLVEMPSQTPPALLRKIDLVDPCSREPICVGDLVELPGTQALVVMALDGRMLHLLQGSELSHSLGITLLQGVARSICADKEHLVIALSTGQLVRVAIMPWLAKNEGDTGSTVIDLDLLKAQHSDITHAEGIDLTVVRMVALQSRDEFTRVLLYGPTLSDLWIATCSMPKVQVQQLALYSSKAVQGSITFQQACLCQSSGLIYLADFQGGRVFQLDPDSGRGRLKVIAGDGVSNSSAWPQCGPADSTRLGAITGICAFEISKAFAQSLSDVATPVEPPEWWERGLVRGKPPKSIRHEQLASALQESGFLVVVDQASEAAVTISFPNNRSDSRKPQRRVWPLLPSQVPSRSDRIRTERDSTLRLTHTRVCMGPGSSLLFWQPGSSYLNMYAPTQSTLAEIAKGKREQQRILQKLSKEKQWTDT